MCLVTGCMLAYAYRYIKSGYKNKTFEGTMDLIRGAMLLIASVIIACVLLSTNANAQNVVRKGNTFEQISSRQKKFAGAIKTHYTYKDANGVVYPIYISKNNKVFIIKINKKGKQYPYYLKDIEDQILHEYGRK